MELANRLDLFLLFIVKRVRSFVAQEFGHIFASPSPHSLTNDSVGDRMRCLMDKLSAIEGLSLAGRGVISIFLHRETLDLFLNLCVYEVTRWIVIVAQHLKCGALVDKHHGLTDLDVAGGSVLVLELELLVRVQLPFVHGVAARIKNLSFLPI